MKDNLDINNKDQNLQNIEKNSNSQNLLSQIELNVINEGQKDGNSLSNNYYEKNGNNNKNNNNCKSLKFWLFILIAIIIVIMIILIIYLYLNKDENEDENKEDNIQYSFELIYYSDKDNETISLINSSFIESIYKMEINNETINPQSEYLFKNSKK